MDIVDKLNKEFSTQNFAEGQPYDGFVEKYRQIASNYAQIENSVAVLSDLYANVSYIYYGSFSGMLGLGGCEGEDMVSSIWEKQILDIIHPDDLVRKHLHELYFFQFIRRQPKHKRCDYYLASKLRMKSCENKFLPVLHRMFYFSTASNDVLRLALCLYNPLVFDIPADCFIINSVNGQMMEIGNQNASNILSAREKQVLTLIDKGLTSCEIAESLFISINTVSRHRQSILSKLQVKNSVEACRVARDLKLM